MKTFQINLQTILFLTDDSVLGAFSRHNKILVYNKPIVSKELLDEMIESVKTFGDEVKTTYQTDSFGVNFYDPNSGGCGEFHSVKGKPLEGVDPIIYNETITKTMFEHFKSLLKELAPDEYEEDAQDGFVGAYEYWTKLGLSRFSQHKLGMIRRLKEKSENSLK